MDLLKKLWYKLFPIREYVKDIHYSVLECQDTDVCFLTIQFLKGQYRGAIVGFCAEYTDEDTPQLVIKPILLKHRIGGSFWEWDDIIHTTKGYEIVMKIFANEYQIATQNYKRVRKDVLNDETDDLGTDYFEEPVAQRTLYKKGSATSKRRVFSQQRRKTPLSGNERLHTKIQPPADHGSDTDIFTTERRDI